ncbi:hypothetical protein AAHH80_37240, partial [Burkholderia pseudomallei]
HDVALRNPEGALSGARAHRAPPPSRISPPAAARVGYIAKATRNLQKSGVRRACGNARSRRLSC